MIPSKELTPGGLNRYQVLSLDSDAPMVLKYGTGPYPRVESRYTVHQMACNCEAGQFGRRCRHIIMSDTARRVFVCPRCGPAKSGDIDAAFAYRSLPPRIACLRCEATLAEMGMPVEVTTLAPHWLNSPLTPEDELVGRAMLKRPADLPLPEPKRRRKAAGDAVQHNIPAPA